MMSTYFSLFLGLCQAAILSKDLQQDIGSKFFLPSDLLKVGLVDKNWIGVEQSFNRITPNAGLFENKQTKEIIFETKTDNMPLSELNGLFAFFYEIELISEMPHTIVEERKWDKMFFLLTLFLTRIRHEPLTLGFLSALAEIVNIDGSAVCADMLVPDQPWSTNIHFAVRYFSPLYGADTGKSDVLEILLRRPGANPNIKNERGETPLHFAIRYSNVEAINILVKFGGNINAQDNELKTPLMWALEGGDFSVIEAVLNHGGDPEMKDETGKTALHLVKIINL